MPLPLDHRSSPFLPECFPFLTRHFLQHLACGRVELGSGCVLAITTNTKRATGAFVARQFSICNNSDGVMCGVSNKPIEEMNNGHSDHFWCLPSSCRKVARWYCSDLFDGHVSMMCAVNVMEFVPPNWSTHGNALNSHGNECDAIRLNSEECR
ncbi:hypothetical protein OG21DRAFT_1275236 [Imleria badia]|nr:hypothetical protein OG21DRAFT_1275236 [Imleria badia]